MCPSANSMHELSANVEVRDENLASFEKGVDQANTGDGYVGLAGKQGRNKADITWMPSSAALMSCSFMRLLVLPRRPLLVVRPCFQWDVGRLLVVRPALLGRWVGPYVAFCHRGLLHNLSSAFVDI